MDSGKKNKALFLDRDGTINIEKKYLCKIEDFEFTRGIIPLISDYHNRNFKIIIITNQSGLARNFYTLEEYQKLTNWMLQEFEKHDIPISKVYHCPHHPDITGDCSCRKPKPGMILQAINEFNIDPEKSVLIGDKESDILAGENAGIGKNLYIHDLI